MKNKETDDFDKLLDDFIAHQLEEYDKNPMNEDDEDIEQIRKRNEDFDNELEDFINQLNYDDEENDKEEERSKKENIFPLGYQWIVENIELSPQSEWIIDNMREYSNGSIYEFQNLFLYKYYYRFIRPIEYNHPNYPECEESFWPLLFQLAFAEKDNVKIVDRGNQLPEVELDYMFERRTISSLSLEEVKSLTLELASSTFNETLLRICNTENSNLYYVREDRPILKEELLFLYECNQNTKKEYFDFIDTIYNRITRCDVETMPYRFNKNREITEYRYD